LLICRSGASTVAELAATGRPALLVPYPHATDDHQAANARAFAEAGAGWAIPQSSLTPALLAERLVELLGDGASLSQAAAQARRFGCDDAAERLAALALELAPRTNTGDKRHAA
jgi:UDP-N-acetylglucosamine--N-acetylmuramyl-(pentapeptide) pyrophosphoryl-undecaprenol N-acetylglucosamine transferase